MPVLITVRMHYNLLHGIEYREDRCEGGLYKLKRTLGEVDEGRVESWVISCHMPSYWCPKSLNDAEACLRVPHIAPQTIPVHGQGKPLSTNHRPKQILEESQGVPPIPLLHPKKYPKVRPMHCPESYASSPNGPQVKAKAFP